MLVYATVKTDHDEAIYGIGKSCGTHFYQADDPKNPKNKVLKVVTRTTSTTLNSTTNITGALLSESPTACEFEMRYYFETIPWLYNPKYFTIEFISKSNSIPFALRFEAMNYSAGASSSELMIRREGGELIEGTSILADRWYTVRFEYYFKDGRLKIYIGEDEPVCVADVEVPCTQSAPPKAAIVHSATKIRGTQYFDYISFNLTDKKYIKGSSEERTATRRGTVYDFKSGIPSGNSFNIVMLLKNRRDEIVPLDPAAMSMPGVKNTSVVHSRNSYEIMLMLSGEATLFSGDKEFCMQPKSIFIAAPSCAYEITTSAGYSILSISGDFPRLSFIKGVAALQDGIGGEGRRLAELILYNRFGNEDYLESLCDAYIKFILLNLERSPANNVTGAIYKIIDQMEKRFGNSDLSIGKLLSESGYAQDYIRAEFLALTKTTPKKYLTDIRMKNAKTMIDIFGNDMSISEIAERCGILDPSVFSRIFKKYFGISPIQYRDSKKQ